ncbi:MAG: helicase C-terminal domain-containing protein [Nitrososphaerota archaeon]
MEGSAEWASRGLSPCPASIPQPGKVRVIDLEEDVQLTAALKRHFPHPTTRKYQADLANRLYELLSDGNRDVVVEAPTGLGKTAAVYAAVAKYAEENNLRVLWLTRTASQVKHVSLETGMLPLYGRKLLCLHEVIAQIDQRRFNAACRATRYAHRCPYWPGKPRAVGRPMTVSELKDVGRRTLTCPYEVLTISMPTARGLVATHRQLGFLGWLLAKWRWSKERTILVLDEAQHVVSEALSMVKDSISLRTLKRAAREARKYGFNEISSELERAANHYESLLPGDGEAEVDDVLPSYTELREAGFEIQELKLRENLAPASHVLTVADFKASLGGSRPLLVREGRSLRLEAMADPKEVLEAVYDKWRATVTMSATVSAELLERLVGREMTLLRAGWPFGDNLSAAVVKGLTTKFEKRDEKLYSDAAWLLKLVAGRRSLIFLPSHEVLEEVLKRADAEVLAEKQGMTQEEVDAIARAFEVDSKALVSVFNGRLAEGIDLSAELVLLIGVPFAAPTPRREKLLRRLKELLGDEDSARLHGLVLPAVYSAVQAAGRAIRGPEDNALVLLVDDRYRRLLPLLPR